MDFKEYLYLEKTRWKKEVAPEKQGALGRKIAAQKDDPLAKKKPGKPSRTITLSDPDDRPLRSLASKERPSPSKPTPSRRSTDEPKPKPQTTATATATDTKKGSPFQPPPGTPKIMLNPPGKPKSPDPGAAAGQSSTSPKKPSSVVDPMRAYVGGQTANPAPPKKTVRIKSAPPTPTPAGAPLPMPSAPASSAPQKGGILRRLAGVSGRLAGRTLRPVAKLPGKVAKLPGKIVSSAVMPGGLIRQATLAAALPPETRSSEFLRRWRQYRGKSKPKKGTASTPVEAPTGTEGTR